MIFSPTTETTGRHSGAMQSIEPGISRRISNFRIGPLQRTVRNDND